MGKNSSFSYSIPILSVGYSGSVQFTFNTVRYTSQEVSLLYHLMLTWTCKPHVVTRVTFEEEQVLNNTSLLVFSSLKAH
jgi:hypothetical protein